MGGLQLAPVPAPRKSAAFPRRGHGKGAARPFQTPKGKSKRKKASRFAKRFFLVSPVYGFADGFKFSLDYTSSKGVKFAIESNKSVEAQNAKTSLKNLRKSVFGITKCKKQPSNLYFLL